MRIGWRGHRAEERADQRRDRGVRPSHQLARGAQQREDDHRQNGGIETNDRRQSRHLGVADIERHHQGGERDACQGLFRQVGLRNPPYAFEELKALKDREPRLLPGAVAHIPCLCWLALRTNDYFVLFIICGHDIWRSVRVNAQIDRAACR